MKFSKIWSLSCVSFLCIAYLTSCAQMKKKDEERVARMEKLADIPEGESIPVTETDYERVKPYLKSSTIDGKEVHVVYKAGKLRKEWMKVAHEGLALPDKEFKKVIEQEIFNAQHFQEYIVWLPRKADPQKIQIFQKVAGKNVKPFYVEPMDGGSALIQSLFPFTHKNIFPMLVRFKRQGRQVPPLVVQLDQGKSTQFQWRRPKASR